MRLIERVSSDRALRTSTLILFGAAILLYCVAFYYQDIGCDGAWYAYPALELSRGGRIDDNLRHPDQVLPVSNVKALFGFATFGNVRTLYAALWFKVFSPSIISIKLLSLVEFMLLLACALLIMHRLAGSWILALFLAAIYANDKIPLMGSANDFRPDIAVAAGACLLLWSAFSVQAGTPDKVFLSLVVFQRHWSLGDGVGDGGE